MPRTSLSHWELFLSDVEDLPPPAAGKIVACQSSERFLTARPVVRSSGAHLGEHGVFNLRENSTRCKAGGGSVIAHQKD